MPIAEYRDTVTFNSINELMQQVRIPSHQRRIYIGSNGGNPEAILEQATAIQSSAFVAVGGSLASAAIYLFALGQERIASIHSTFHFHRMRIYSGENDEWLTLPQLQLQAWQATHLGHHRAWVQYCDDIAEGYSVHVASLDLLVESTGTERGVFLNLMENEVTLTAAEALRLNLVHQIVPSDQINEMLGYR